MATTKKALAAKSGKKMGSHTVPKERLVLRAEGPVAKKVQPDVLSEKLTQLSELLNLAKANATGDRSPQSYSAEMDALGKASVLLEEIRAL